MELVYLDNNATTRPHPKALEAMRPFLEEWYGNPSSIHRFGQRSRAAMDEARSQVAGLVGCSDSEILFTGGGTESVNTAIRGLFHTRAPRKRIVTSTVEHSATRQLLLSLALEGAEVIHVPVDVGGALDMDFLEKSINDQTALATFLWANNETGVKFPVEKISQWCEQAGVPLHLDGTQAVGKIPVSTREIHCSAMSFAAHKFHGVKGTAGLYVKSGVRIPPLLIGGPQERDRRGGTENVPGIVAMGAAAVCALEGLPHMSAVAALRDQLENRLLAAIPDSHVNGDTTRRIPNTTNIGFAPLEAEAILILLSEKNICASAGAACSSGSLEPSPILAAMHIPSRIAHGAIRFSLSHFTTEADIDRAVAVMPGIIQKLRSVMPR